MRFRVPALLAASALALPLMAADTVYTYTGQNFTTLIGGGSYALTDSVTGWFTVASPLTANIPSSLIIPAAYSFSDGVQTLSSSSPSLTSQFRVGTDGIGDITNWSISVSWSTVNEIYTTSVGGVSQDEGFMGAAEGLIGQHPGTWVESTASAVPEPGTLILFASALLGMAGPLSANRRDSAPVRLADARD